MSPGTLWSRLQQLGGVQGPMPDDAAVPLSVRIMLGLGAWLASLFALGFLAVTLYGVLSEPVLQLLLALVSGVLAWRLAPQAQQRPFAGQIGLVLACLMQLLLFWFVVMQMHSGHGPGLGLMLIGALSLAIASFIWRIWSTWVLVCGSALFLQPLQSPLLLAALVGACALAHAWLLLNPSFGLRQHKLLQPLTLGLGLATLGLTLWHPQLGWSSGLLLQFTPQAGFDLLAASCTAALVAVNLYAGMVIGSRLGLAPLLKAGALLLILLLGVCTWITPATSAALGLLLLGFARAQPVQQVVGLIGLLLALSAHYYALAWSLNFKAASLFALGALLLLARWMLRRNATAAAAGESSQ